MTNWENIVSGKELITAKNKRKNLYIEARERKVALEELEEEGWEYVKDYADSKFVKVRKEKPFYERFEDQIWLLFFQMGFKHLNRDANFKMNYDTGYSIGIAKMFFLFYFCKKQYYCH